MTTVEINSHFSYHPNPLTPSETTNPVMGKKICSHLRKNIHLIILQSAAIIGVTVLTCYLSIWTSGGKQDSGNGTKTESASTTKEDVSGLTCYECTSSNASLQDLPYEYSCSDKPRNARQCNQGELCGFFNITTPSNFYRRCLNSSNVGCEPNVSSPGGTICSCNTNYCL